MTRKGAILCTVIFMNKLLTACRHEQAFVCNLLNHWFTLRRFGPSTKRWYNLNSLQARPSWISETYLVAYLAQLLQEGYTIFVVTGHLPACAADDSVLAMPEPTGVGNAASASPSARAPVRDPIDRTVLQGTLLDDDFENDMEAAIAASLGR